MGPPERHPSGTQPRPASEASAREQQQNAASVPPPFSPPPKPPVSPQHCVPSCEGKPRLRIPILDKLLPDFDTGDLLLLLILLLLISDGNEDSTSLMLTIAIFLFMQ